MAHELTIVPTGAADLLERWRADLDALARQKDAEALRRQEVHYALTAVDALLLPGRLAAPFLAELSRYARTLAEQIERAPRFLVRDPEVTEQLAELDG